MGGRSLFCLLLKHFFPFSQYTYVWPILISGCICFLFFGLVHGFIVPYTRILKIEWTSFVFFFWSMPKFPCTNRSHIHPLQTAHTYNSFQVIELDVGAPISSFSSYMLGAKFFRLIFPFSSRLLCETLKRLNFLLQVHWFFFFLKEN